MSVDATPAAPDRGTEVSVDATPAAPDGGTEVSVDATPFALGDVGGRGPAALCLHGLTGTPYEIRHPAEALAERGFACLGPELPGHGSTPQVLAATPRVAWLDAVLAAFDRLAATHERVYVVGLSLGGVLALALCQRRPVHGSVVLAAPLELRRAVRWLVPLLAPAIRSIPKTSDIVDDQARARHPGYRRMPLAAVRELMRLQREVERGLDRVEAPLRLIYSRSDRTVRFEDAERIRRQVSSPEPQVITLDRSGHVLPVDLERERVSQEVVDFLCGLEGAAPLTAPVREP